MTYNLCGHHGNKGKLKQRPIVQQCKALVIWYGFDFDYEGGGAVRISGTDTVVGNFGSKRE